MSTVDGNGTALGHRLERGASGHTFVNALTGSGAMWEAAIAPALRAKGHGTLTVDLPGQAESPLPPTATVTADDLTRATAGIVRALAPAGPARHRLLQHDDHPVFFGWAGWRLRPTSPAPRTCSS